MQRQELIIAGSIFGNAEIQKVGADSDIGVPHLFFKLVISENQAVPFLFVHEKRVSQYGCELTDELED